GNVRELENLIQHMSILHGGKEVRYNDLPAKYRGEILPQLQEATESSSPDVSVPEQLLLFSCDPQQGPGDIWDENGVDFKGLVNEFETRLILKALKTTNGNKKEAARLLNLKRTTLLEKIKKKELQWNN
ncbi:MAG TPA: sigma-54-dependent Fis family transcriptional regulator, partial [Desulfobulbaceae bacterium]|nr:sigma-54-dependent Fis family transcriptional regulator [Desulfobulbaceae bacterium]